MGYVRVARALTAAFGQRQGYSATSKCPLMEVQICWCEPQALAHIPAKTRRRFVKMSAEYGTVESLKILILESMERKTDCVEIWSGTLNDRCAQNAWYQKNFCEQISHTLMRASHKRRTTIGHYLHRQKCEQSSSDLYLKNSQMFHRINPGRRL